MQGMGFLVANGEFDGKEAGACNGNSNIFGRYRVANVGGRQHVHTW